MPRRSPDKAAWVEWQLRIARGLGDLDDDAKLKRIQGRWGHITKADRPAQIAAARAANVANAAIPVAPAAPSDEEEDGDPLNDGGGGPDEGEGARTEGSGVVTTGGPAPATSGRDRSPSGSKIVPSRDGIRGKDSSSSGKIRGPGRRKGRQARKVRAPSSSLHDTGPSGEVAKQPKPGSKGKRKVVESEPDDEEPAPKLVRINLLQAGDTITIRRVTAEKNPPSWKG